MMELITTPAEWLERAAEATDALDFDVCVARAFPLFNREVARVESARETMFGQWHPAHVGATLAGMRAYATKRTALEEAGYPTVSAHREAKAAALAEYRYAQQGGQE